MELTVNQLLDFIFSRYAWDEIRSRTDIKKIADALFFLKRKNRFGGMIRVKNSAQLIEKLGYS